MGEDLDSSTTPSLDTPIQGVAAFANAAARLTENCDSKIDILSLRLQPELWASAPFIEQIKRIAITRSRSKIRILLAEPGVAAKSGNRLLELSTQLSSAITVRGLSPMHNDVQVEWLLGDEEYALIREPADRLDAKASENDRVIVKTHRERFNHYWDNSILAADLRRLHI